LLLALKVLSEGDTLVVTRLDRLGRSLRDLANIAHEIEAKGAALRVLEQSVDTSTSAGCKSRSNNPSVKRPIGLAAPEQNCGS
jgi:DNA invertase Pin-like site-specific DNA recombinase